MDNEKATELNASTFWEATDRVVASVDTIRRCEMMKRDSETELRLYRIAMAYLLYPWYKAHATEVDRSGVAVDVDMEQINTLLLRAMERPALRVPDKLFRKFVFSGRLVPGGDVQPLVMVDHDTLHKCVSYLVEHVGNTPGPLPPKVRETLIENATALYKSQIDSTSATAPVNLDTISKAKDLLCLIGDLDVEVSPKSRERLVAFASGKNGDGSACSYDPVWINPAFKLAKNIGKLPFNIVTLCAPDNNEDYLYA